MSKITGNATVYYGLNPSTYNSNGSVLKSGDIVTALWKENNYVHIEYTSGSKKKRGFVEAGVITVQESIAGITNTRAVRYVGIAGSSYDGPGTNYMENKPLPKGKKVWFVGQKPNGYACIEYSIGANDDKNKIRVYMLASKLSDSFNIGGQTFKQGDKLPSGYPYAGRTVNQGFNDEKTSLRGHLGYDISGKQGDTIVAIEDGIVVSTTQSLSSTTYNGRVVTLQHSKNGKTFYSSYCHLSAVSVSVGDTVKKNGKIGEMGGSGENGENTFGVHLHLAVYTGQKSSSPNGYCAATPHKKRFEEVAANYANLYYYGSNTTNYPRCGGVKFYDPYAAITSGYSVFDKC